MALKPPKIVLCHRWPDPKVGSLEDDMPLLTEWLISRLGLESTSLGRGMPPQRLINGCHQPLPSVRRPAQQQQLFHHDWGCSALSEEYGTPRALATVQGSWFFIDLCGKNLHRTWLKRLRWNLYWSMPVFISEPKQLNKCPISTKKNGWTFSWYIELNISWRIFVLIWNAASPKAPIAL